MSIASYRLYVMSYLCVRLSTVSTDVGFHMLGVPVLGDVLQQGGLVSEALVAGVALVGLVALVAAGVGLEVGQLGEGLGAAWGEMRGKKHPNFLCQLQLGGIDRSDRHSIGRKKSRNEVELGHKKVAGGRGRSDQGLAAKTNEQLFRLTWDAALVRLVPGVSPDVLLQVGQLSELPLTDLAAVRLDAKVDPHVLRQVGAVREGFAALAALVGLGFSHVDLGVQLQVGF